MSTGTRLPLAYAERLAARVVELLKRGCERIEVAGSIRRKKPDVGDVEIVAVPKFLPVAPTHMFERPPLASALDTELEVLALGRVIVQHPERPANGEKYKRLWLPKPGAQLDLFIVTPPAEWGPLFAIRTGPAEYAKRLVTALQAKRWRCHEGRVFDQEGGHVPCPEEKDFFAACGEPWTEAEARNA